MQSCIKEHFSCIAVSSICFQSWTEIFKGHKISIAVVIFIQSSQNDEKNCLFKVNTFVGNVFGHFIGTLDENENTIWDFATFIMSDSKWHMVLTYVIQE